MIILEKMWTAQYIRCWITEHIKHGQVRDVKQYGRHTRHG